MSIVDYTTLVNNGSVPFIALKINDEVMDYLAGQPPKVLENAWILGRDGFSSLINSFLIHATDDLLIKHLAKVIDVTSIDKRKGLFDNIIYYRTSNTVAVMKICLAYDFKITEFNLK